MCIVCIVCISVYGVYSVYSVCSVYSVYCVYSVHSVYSTFGWDGQVTILDCTLDQRATCVTNVPIESTNRVAGADFGIAFDLVRSTPDFG